MQSNLGACSYFKALIILLLAWLFCISLYVLLFQLQCGIFLLFVAVLTARQHQEFLEPDNCVLPEANYGKFPARP
jgi:hypothetical protein